MSWLIYKHTNLINGKVYIGQTKQIPNNRRKNGVGYTRDNRLSVFAAAIKKYGWENFSHEIIEENIETQELANKREIYWIKHFNSYIGFDNTNGYNMTLGGDSAEHLGYPVYQIDKKTMKIINEYPSTSEASRQFGNNEGNASQIRRCCDGEKPSCKGYYWCYVKNYFDGWKPKDNALVSPVYQINDEFEIIRRYESITEAKNINGFSLGSIVSCCQRKQRKANNYFWCYEKDYSSSWTPVECSFKRNEKVYCFETNKVYNNSLEASKETKANRNHILKVCRGLENSASGLHFCYVNEKDKYIIKNNADESPVVCVNTGKHYKIIVEASKDTGCSQSCISACCRGVMKTSKGLTWCYEKNYINGIAIDGTMKTVKINQGKEKPIICVETEKVYKSASQACRELGISHGNMGCALKDNYPAGGFHFAYISGYDKNKWKPRKNKAKKKIVCVETKIMYDSAATAEKETGATRCNINRALKSGGTAGGYHWKYVDKN